LSEIGAVYFAGKAVEIRKNSGWYLSFIIEPGINERGTDVFAQLHMLIFAAIPAKSTAPISLKLAYFS
jgi:hypothetical protein